MSRKYSKIAPTYRFVWGFTLIELLVTVAILSLLFAILFPALHKARALANRIVCQSNLKQITLAWHMYFDNNDGLFYRGGNHNYDFGGWQGNVPGNALHRPLNSYLNLPLEMEQSDGAEVFRCPADVGSESNPEMAYLRWGNSYQTNLILVEYGLPAESWVPEPHRLINEEINKHLRDLQFTRVSNPSLILFIGDRYWVTQWESLWTRSAGKDWHGKCHHYNIAFLDGHVDHVGIYKGLYVGSKYRVQPFKEVDSVARELQKPLPCPRCGQPYEE